MVNTNTQWERRPGEPARAYGYVWDYFILGPQRSIEKVIQVAAKKLQPLQKPPSLGTLKNLSSKWRWPKRAAAYDRWRERKNWEEAEVLAVEDAKKRVQRQREADESDHEIRMLLREQIKSMAKYPLSEKKLVSERYADGREKVTHIIKPAGWSKGNIPGLWQAVQTSDRSALRNEGGTSTDVELNDVLNLVDYGSARPGARKK